MSSTTVSRFNRSMLAGQRVINALSRARRRQAPRLAPARFAASNTVRFSPLLSGGVGVVRAPTSAGSILQIGSDGAAKCQISDHWPRRILFAIDNPFACEDPVRIGLSIIERLDMHVHLLWVAERPVWINRSFNRSMVLENLQYSRQRAAMRLEHVSRLLNDTGYSATWEADETNEPRAKRIEHSAREMEADLILIPNTLESAWTVTKGWKDRQRDEAGDFPVLTIGPGSQVALLNEPSAAVFEPRSMRLKHGIPPPRRPEQPEAPAGTTLSSRSRHS